MKLDRSILLILFLGVAYCGDSSPGEPGEALYEYVPDGKLDDYRSTTGMEFTLTARDRITLDGADLELEGEERVARAQELVELRFKALSFFLYAYLAAKSSHDDNYGYGDFRTTVRQDTFDALEMAESADEPGTYEFLFEAECAGPPELISRLDLDEGLTFRVILPILTNADLESGTYSSTYKYFDPEDLDESLLTEIQVAIAPQESEPDAYPQYAELFDDGLLDVAIQVGGDYNDSRWDLVTARDLFDALQEDLDLTAPVATFEELTSQSGAFVGTLRTEGEEIDLEVYLYHPDMYQEDGVGYTGLMDIYRQAAATRDIVIYDGHAGYNTSYSGIVVHYNPRYAIPADDFMSLELPERYQIFVFNGCKTYTSYADAMYAHELKDSSNLDIITTVNFSWLSDMTRVTSDLLGFLLTTNGDGLHVPASYDHILGELNSGRSWDVIYGVHGLSDNPRLSPYAQTSALCQRCGSNDECPGTDSLCLLFENEVRGCTMACTDTTGCPDGYTCRQVAELGTNLLSRSQCVPSSGSCQ